MPPRNLPNSLIYLQALFRPRSLRPDVFVPSVSHLDWPAIRKLGFNGVVVDKDNCLTWPENDELHPSISAGWKSLRDTFGSRRILVVSNSAGTRKDPGGIAAESVSRHLQVPVLLHAQAKPGCASQILDYFEGRIEINRVAPVRVETISEVPLQTEEKISVSGSSTLDVDDKARLSQPIIAIPSPPNPPLRLLVIGDRLATDVLLAQRLRKHLPTIAAATSDETPRVLSIITTELFKPSDVGILRWLESKWSTIGGGMTTAPGRIDWGRYVFDRSVDDVITREVLMSDTMPRSGLFGKWDNLKSRTREVFTINTVKRVGRALIGMTMNGARRLGSEIILVSRRLLQRSRRRGSVEAPTRSEVVTIKST